MLFGHTCGFWVFMDFKEKLIGLASVMRDPGVRVALFFALGCHMTSSCLSVYLGANGGRQGVWGLYILLR